MSLLPDRKYALGMLLISVVYCVSALLLDTDFDPVNEKYYPFVLSVLMIASSIALFIWPSSHAATWPEWKNLQKIGITFSAVLLYSFVFETVGFIISASILMGACMWVFEAPVKWIAPVSISTSVCFYVVFDRLLALNLPMGLLDFS